MERPLFGCVAMRHRIPQSVKTDRPRRRVVSSLCPRDEFAAMASYGANGSFSTFSLFARTSAPVM